MKTRLPQLILALPLILLSTSAHGALVGIDSAAGTLADGSGITYTVATTGPALSFGASAGDTSATSSGGLDATITFTFSAAVTFQIDDTIQSSRPFNHVQFDYVDATADPSGGPPYSSVFLGDVGSSWALTTTSTGAGINSSGNTLNFPGFNDSADWGKPGPDWGVATITGVTTVTWTKADISNTESYNFSAMGPVPEPSSTILLLTGLLAFSARRSR